MSTPGPSLNLNAATLVSLIRNLDRCIELIGSIELPSAQDIQSKSILSAMRREMIFHLAERVDEEEGSLLPDGSAAPFGVISAAPAPIELR